MSKRSVGYPGNSARTASGPGPGQQPVELRLYGLTGGIASGKSEAARCFTEQDIPVIDADRIGHEVIAPGGPAEQVVRDAFGPDILTDGAIDRRKLGQLVFHNAQARQQLNALVHPHIYTRIFDVGRELEAEGRRCAIVEAALLGDDGRLRPGIAGLILVLCPEPVRVERLIRSRGMPREEALARIRAQTPPEEKRRIAMWTINNDGSLEALDAQCRAIAKELLDRAR